MIQNYKKDGSPQGTKFQSIAKSKLKFIIKNMNDNWDLDRKSLMKVLIKLQVCSQETVKTIFMNFQIF